MKNNFKKFLAVLTVFVMALGVVALPNATAQAAESGTYKTGQTWWGSGSYMVGYAADNSTIEELETQMGYWPEGGFNWWKAVVFELQDDGTWVVKEIIEPSDTNNLGGIKLTTGRLVVTYHEEVLNMKDFDGAKNKAFFDSLKVGDVCTALGLWGNEVTFASLTKNEDQVTFTKVASSSDNAGSDNTGSDNAGSNNAGSNNAGSNNAGSNNAGSNNAGNTNVPATGDSTPVAVMASMLLVAVACVALGLKKRNA